MERSSSVVALGACVVIAGLALLTLNDPGGASRPSAGRTVASANDRAPCLPRDALDIAADASVAADNLEVMADNLEAAAENMEAAAALDAGTPDMTATDKPASTDCATTSSLFDTRTIAGSPSAEFDPTGNWWNAAAPCLGQPGLQFLPGGMMHASNGPATWSGNWIRRDRDLVLTTTMRNGLTLQMPVVERLKITDVSAGTMEVIVNDSIRIRFKRC